MDKVVLVVSDDQPTVRTAPISPREVAGRMAASVSYEENQFLEYYQAFRFAFPERRNPFLDELDSVREALLGEALAGCMTYEVRHPYPVSFDDLVRGTEAILLA